MKTKHTLLLILLSTQMLAISPAKANFLDRAKEKLQKAKEVSKEKLGQLSEAAKETYENTKNDIKEKLDNVELPSSKLEVKDSKIRITESVPSDTQFVFYTITYNSVTEQATPFMVTDTQIDFDLGLMKGNGDYKIEIYATKGERVGNGYSLVDTINVTNNDSEDKRYLLPSLKVQSTEQDIINLANEITANSATDREKAAALYHWIAENISYDYDIYERWLKQDPTALYGDTEDALNVLQARKATCNGYTNLFAALARSIGLKTQIIWGQGNNAKHAWNKVLVEGVWENIDTTWAAAYVKSSRPNLFLFTSEEDFNKDHKNPVVQENN